METLRQALDLIGRENRLRLAVLVPAALVVSGAEMLGAGLVYSLLSLATGARDPLDLPLLGSVLGAFDVAQDVLVFGIAIALGVFFLGLAVAKTAHAYLQNRVMELMAARIASRMMVGYLAMPYAFHLRRNSSELIRNTNSAVGSVFSEAIKPMVQMIAEILIAIGFLVVLITVSPLATALAVVVLGTAAGLLMKVIHPRLKRLGARRHQLAKDTLQTLQQAFHGIRDVKILGGEGAFGRRYERERRRVARVTYRKSVINTLPSTVIELALLGFILLFFLVMVAVGQDTPETLAVLGLFAYAGQRLQNSIQKVVSAFNHLRFGAAPIADLQADLAAIREHETLDDSDTSLPFEREIELERVSFRYEGAHGDALRGIDLTIRRGEVLGICGPTGGGKTTLIDIISGLLTPTVGRVTVDGQDLRDHARAWQRNLGVVPQMVFLTDASLRDNIALAAPAGKIDEDAVNEAVDLAQLRDFVDSLPDGLDTIVGERGVRVSGGQRQRVAIARALYRHPGVLIFDEGTSALDNATEREVMAAISRLRGDHTILLVAHRLSTVRSADRVLLLKDGAVAALGRYDELLASSPDFAVLAST